MKTIYTMVFAVMRAQWLLMGIFLAIGLGITPQDAGAGQQPVDLGSAGSFAVLAGATVTSTGGGTIDGDVGVWPGITFVVGVPPVVVDGTVHLDDSIAMQAQADLTTAYNDAAGRTVGVIGIADAGELGGKTLVPGLYNSNSGEFKISLVDLTLDAQGDPNAVWIFQMGSTLTVGVGRKVILSGGAQAKNIFWQVGSSATLETTAVFKGTILALTSISVKTGASLDGRALASNGAVTLDANTLTKPEHNFKWFPLFPTYGIKHSSL